MSLRNNDILWPVIQLTPEEEEYCRIYREEGMPGVRWRSYPVDLVFANALPNETSVLEGKYVPSGRYTRVFAVGFSGAIPYFRIEVRTNSDEILIEECSVAALCGLAGNGFSFAGAQTAYGLPQFNLLQQSPEPVLFEPSIVLPGATNILVSGSIEPNFLEELTDETPARAVLHMLFFVWEFPDVLENLAGPKRPRAAANGKGARR